MLSSIHVYVRSCGQESRWLEWLEETRKTPAEIRYHSDSQVTQATPAGQSPTTRSVPYSTLQQHLESNEMPNQTSIADISKGILYPVKCEWSGCNCVLNSWNTCRKVGCFRSIFLVCYIHINATHSLKHVLNTHLNSKKVSLRNEL